MFNNYLVWLIIVSVLIWALERLKPWRPQKALRSQIWQDFFWLFFNGYLFAIIVATPSGWLDTAIKKIFSTFHFVHPESLSLFHRQPFWIQFVLLIFLKDFIEWWVHLALHRYNFLWNFHKIHHSIKEMDWIGNMRFHWMEIVIYRSVKYLPIVALGIHWKVVLSVAVFSTFIGHLNHSNLNFGWGPLKYIFNSPRFHIWHHDYINHYQYGQNFAIIFSFWDRLFGKAYIGASEQPEQLGFKGEEKVPASLWQRMIYPVGS